jgi:hypothetical protein
MMEKSTTMAPNKNQDTKKKQVDQNVTLNAVRAR